MFWVEDAAECGDDDDDEVLWWFLLLLSPFTLPLLLWLLCAGEAGVLPTAVVFEEEEEVNVVEAEVETTEDGVEVMRLLSFRDFGLLRCFWNWRMSSWTVASSW